MCSLSSSLESAQPPWLRMRRKEPSASLMNWIGPPTEPESTTIIAPPDGNLNDYLSSLDRLLELPVETLHSAHGPPIENARARIEEIRDHRNERTRQALEALQAGNPSIPELVDQIYTELPEEMKPAAQMSLLAHLLALVEEGKAAIVDENPDPMQVRYQRL